MKFHELKNRSGSELKELLATTEAELHAVSQKARSHQLKQVHKVGIARKTLARLRTILVKS